MPRNRSIALLAAFAVALAVLPPVLHALLSRAPSVSPEEAKEALARAPGTCLLVDMRKDATYGLALPGGTVREPAPERLSATLLKSKERVFLLCNVGWRSDEAARELRQKGFSNVFSVAGGVEAWSAGAAAACRSTQGEAHAGPDPSVRRIAFTPLEQFLICFTSFGLKPLYGLFSLGVVIALRRRPEAHWRALRWGLLAFFLGEGACAVNFLFYGLENFTWEFWHCYGMLVAFGAVSYALVTFADQQLIRYSLRDAPCAFLGLCKACYKHQPVACNLWVLFLFTVPALGLLCLIPLAAPLKNFMSVGDVYGSDVLFTHSVLQQLYEVRVYPLLALFLFAATWALLLWKREAGMEASKPLFAAGLGALGFSLMRFLIYWSFAENVLWAQSWEEITEFVFAASVVVLLCVKRIGRRLRAVQRAG